MSILGGAHVGAKQKLAGASGLIQVLALLWPAKLEAREGFIKDISAVGNPVCVMCWFIVTAF